MIKVWIVYWMVATSNGVMLTPMEATTDRVACINRALELTKAALNYPNSKFLGARCGESLA